MIKLHRARLVLVVAIAGALIVIAAEFPLSELLHQHAELALVRGQLSTLASRNASLTADIDALSSSSTVNAIAHEEYGLVQPGQLSFVILPTANSAAAKQGLSMPAIAPQDLLAAAPEGDHSVIPSPENSSGSFWGRFVSHLEFWQWGR
jgi:cell division protein FtsB